MEFVRKTTQDDYVIIANRLRADFNVVFYKSDDPSVLESFKIPTQIKNIKVTLYKNGTLLVRGDSATREYQHVVSVISEILDAC